MTGAAADVPAKASAPAPAAAAPKTTKSTPTARQLGPPLIDTASLLADLHRRLPTGITLPDKAPAAPPTAKAITCPTQNVTLTPGVDVLYAAFQTNGAGVTYLLPPGKHTLSSTISLTPGTVTCYQGIDPATGGAPAKDSVKILVSTQGPMVIMQGRFLCFAIPN